MAAIAAACGARGTSTQGRDATDGSVQGPDADVGPDSTDAPEERTALDGAGEVGDVSDNGASAPPGEAGAVGVGTIYSGVPWLDTSGNWVNAHGVGFIQVDDTFYMVGEQRSGKNDTYSGSLINAEDAFTGVNMYSTKDFVNWTFVGTVVTPIAGTVVAPPYYGERPKILHSSSTGKYVIYIKMLNYTGSPPVYRGNFAVLTSTTISGPYEYVGLLGTVGSPLQGASDFQLFEDTDGTQYLAQAGGLLYRLSADGTTLATGVSLRNQSGEGVSLFKVNDRYFWQSSQGTYWHANDNSYTTATSISMGSAWSAPTMLCPPGSYTWQSQDTAVVKVKGSGGTTYIYVGDRWVNGDLPASTLVVQPLTVSGATESISRYYPAWNLDVASGTWSPAIPTGVSVDDDTTGTALNEFSYSGDWTHAMGPPFGSYSNGDAHTSNSTDATATISFTGTRILLYAGYDNASGIMGVTLMDGTGTTALTPEVHVSLRYDAAPRGNYLVYASPTQPAGTYWLKVRVTGMADLYSAGHAINIDRVLVLP